MDFEVKLPLFEGPFDLLLFFIERDELEIYDIPIANITNDFLEYMQKLESLNIQLASDFILIAAKLMRVKSKMLLKRGDEELEEDDPRSELVQSLLEYKKYRSVLPLFEQMEEDHAKKHKRGNIFQENYQISSMNEVEFELYTLDLYKLLRVYERLLDKYEIRSQQVKHTVIPYPYTITGQKKFLTKKLKNIKGSLSFKEIMTEYHAQSKVAAIYNFLAILELLQNRIINLRIEEGFNNFWIEPSEAQSEAISIEEN